MVISVEKSEKKYTKTIAKKFWKKLVLYFKTVHQSYWLIYFLLFSTVLKTCIFVYSSCIWSKKHYFGNVESKCIQQVLDENLSSTSSSIFSIFSHKRKTTATQPTLILLWILTFGHFKVIYPVDWIGDINILRWCVNACRHLLTFAPRYRAASHAWLLHYILHVH